MSKIKKKIIFFAYQGRYEGKADENVDAIKSAIKLYNKHQKTYIAKSWEDYKKTTAISNEILNAINKCEVFACDLSYFNHNVLFELGYAIGKKKQIIIYLNKNIDNAEDTYKEFFLKNIRFTSLTNAHDITKSLQQKNFKSGLLKQFVNIRNIQKNTTNIFYIQSKIKNQPSIELSQTIDMFKEEKNLSVVTDDALEVIYKPMNWYFQNIVKSTYTIIHLLGENIINHFIENAQNSFLAGIAMGLNNIVLLLAPSKYRAPLDYHDILIQYQTSKDLVDSVYDWLLNKFKDTAYPEIKPKEERELNLIKLGIGDEVAEHEKQKLLNYFIETASYFAALNSEKSILVGRKGSGKSAIFIRLQDELESEKLNYVISLNPESDELLEDIELSKLFQNDSSRISFFYSVWKLVIFSKLIHSIRNKIIERKKIVSYSQEEKNIIKFYEDNKSFIKLNVFGVVYQINEKLNNSNIDSPKILYNLYSEYLTPLINIIKNYFKSINAKYYKIIILADNLDKTWNPDCNLDVQSELILSLLEIDNKIRKELIDTKDKQIDIKEIIFLRKDIFDYTIKMAKEPDKLTTMSHEINWEEYPHLLKKLIDNRFKFILEIENDSETEKIWQDLFNLKRKEHPYEIIKEIITRRPRDIIYFVQRLFEEAVNKSHTKVHDDDFEYAIDSYTTFLNQNLIAETRAEYPEISEILKKLQEHHGKTIEYKKFSKILDEFKYKKETKIKLIEILFDKGYMLGFDKKYKKPFSDIDTLMKKLKKKKFFFFPNKVFLICHAKYYFIKNRTYKVF